MWRYFYHSLSPYIMKNIKKFLKFLAIDFIDANGNMLFMFRLITDCTLQTTLHTKFKTKDNVHILFFWCTLM